MYAIRSYYVSVEQMEQYKDVVEHVAKLSTLMQKNFSSIQQILDKINSSQHISKEKLQELNNLANSITQASNSLNDEKTLAVITSYSIHYTKLYDRILS